MRRLAGDKRLICRAVRWNNYDLPVAVDALRRAGLVSTAQELFTALKIFCCPKHDEPITFEGGAEFAPACNSVALRMDAARIIVELQRRGYAG